MSAEFPGAVRDHLLAIAGEQWALAYVVLDHQGQVLEVGGDLSHHGLDRVVPLRPGGTAAAALPFLVGLDLDLPEPMVLPNLQVEGGPPVTIHLVPVEDARVWCLFQDQDDAFRAQRDLQRAMYRRILELDERTRLPYSLLTRFRLFALERLGARLFQPLAATPGWVLDLFPELADVERFHVEPGASFLASFLDEAEAFWAAPDGEMLSSGPYEERATSGAIIPVEAHALRLQGKRFLVLEDLGAQHETHRELLQAARERSLAHRQLTRELERKEVLVHCVVHDLASPASSIKLALNLLASKVPEASRPVLETARQAVEAQLTLIDDILEAFEADQAGSNATPPEGLAPGEVVEAAAEQQRLEFAEGGLTLEVAVPAGLPPVRAEERRLRRMVVNFLENARRHAPRGSAVRISLEPVDGALELRVDDGGPGVPPALRAGIFQRLRQEGSVRGKVGLGLYFCRITAQAWGGEVGCDDSPLGGARFWVRLPTLASP